ncbi:MAG: hypothetical protein WAT72_03355 [Microgenomates group bacterium]|mgnify:CR=1 FL=1|jgi:hypothetical protein|nr:hypothetical protein [Candidatus Woesebacteria bacterium]MBP6883560.1 hypothetical protein [Candidatus Woesebacteria bacterium]MDQ5952980.1 hypothetical protein [Patescibacteria group bacterium]QQR63508.1 MAG: hypothetical protein IPH70_03285 [Candidatus Roizmanbacteria bacterium]
MKKEVLVAIVCGVGLGLIVAFVMVRQIHEMEIDKGAQIKTNSGKLQLSTTSQNAQNLEISEPSTDAVVDQSSITIKGKAQSKSFLVFQSTAKDSVMKLGNKSDFSIKLPIIVGENVISITMYPEDKTVRTQEKIIKVYNLQK